MATIRDVSKLAGVSVATVSRVLNKSGYVNKETEETVLGVMKTLDYIPSEMARGLAGKSTSTIALMVPDIINPFFPEVARAIEDVAHSYGYTVILCNFDNNPEKEMNYIQMLKRKRIDGIVIASYTIQPEQILQLEKDSIPVVVIDRSFPSHPILCLTSKNREGARLAVKHLLDQGCRKIAHISGPLYVHDVKERALGYEDLCREQPWFVPSLIVQSDFHIDGGYDSTKELFTRHPDIDGVFAGNDLMAVGVMKSLNELGKKVPKDVKVIGFDDIVLARMVIPELSSVKQPIYGIGKLAMENLIRLITGESVIKKAYELDVELVVRQSTADSE
jgi:LacI family transcriptional regulator